MWLASAKRGMPESQAVRLVPSTCASWRYIAEDSPAAADRLLLRIDDKLRPLRDFPGIGTIRDDIRLGARLLVQGSDIILFEESER